ncbi:hypothetical protein L9F63_020458 [Diploptera punctata]|uniref:Uncharacterized protein n=1 Tax=Diploptera punctata TaxID=6984 RepID=A0AAD8ECY2_DIPPU|nr:hypothetical protein L9F63_020458 [Diploptera punctata]
MAAAGGSGQLNYTTDWWAGAAEEDAIRSLSLDGEGGLWTSSFVPPPPRPDFLDDHATPDGVTTCDLCTWAWHDRGIFSVDTAQENSGELGWVLTLAIVSILSAAVGAIIMVTVLQCRNRLKNADVPGLCSLCMIRSPNPAAATSPSLPERIQNQEDGKEVTAQYDSGNNGGGGARVWMWLTTRRNPAGPAQLCSPAATTPAENHYTLDEAYTTVGEALYAELDRELSNTDPDASAPSSAYYSDLSCATGPDRTYEAVGIALASTSSTSASWDGGDIALRRQTMPRLAAITETITVPSDYV